MQNSHGNTAMGVFDSKSNLKSNGWWIRQTVTRSIVNMSRAIRIPGNQMENIKRMDRTRKCLSVKFGHEPDVFELAEALGVTAGEVKQWLEYSTDTISLDAKAGGTEVDGTTIGELTADEKSASPEEYASSISLKEQIKEVLSTLKERDRKIICMLFGLDGYEPCTLEQVSEEFDISKERVFQCKEEAIKKLRKPAILRKLRDYVE